MKQKHLTPQGGESNAQQGRTGYTIMTSNKNTQSTPSVETTEVVAPLTPYGAHTIVNVRLKEEGLKAIPPQMLYNYTKARVTAGKKPFIKFTPEGGVDRVDLDRWIESYVAKKVAARNAAVEA